MNWRQNLASTIVEDASERRQATILFADISGFTAMSEKLDPEEVTDLVNECFVLLGEQVKEHGGVIDKFMGDCVMALFGVPVALEGAPRKAIEAAIAMRQSIETFSRRRCLAVPLGIHIGVNSGEVLSGRVGTTERQDFTVMGDAVNLASRLKDLAATGQILVGPFTWRSAREAFSFLPLKPASIKGKTELVQMYEVRGKPEGAEVGSGSRVIQSVLVGRGDELKKLELQVMKLVNGEGSVVNLIGEAGIGKSRLCAELFCMDFMKWVTKLEGRSLAVGQTLSWYPIIGILKSWAAITEEDAEEAAMTKLEATIRAIHPEEADEIIPFIATLMGYRLTGAHTARMEGVVSESLGKLIAKHLKDLIVMASGFRPILFVLEDLHWADGSTLELLRSLIMLTNKHPITFLCAWRPGYGETTGSFQSFLAEALPGGFVDIELSALGEDHAGELARNLLKNAGIPEGLMARIVEKAGGNPFFVEEVIRSFIDRGLLSVGKEGLFISKDFDTIEIPNSIDAVIMSRVDRLDEGMKELLRVASVIGRSFFYRILAGVAEAGEGFGSRIEGLKELQLIREHQRVGEVEYLFKHVLVQETIYSSILLRSRKLLHLRVAQAIEEVFADRLPEFFGVLAFHYSQGEEFNKAEEYLEKAGKAALTAAASAEALILLRQALESYTRQKGSKASTARIASLEASLAQASVKHNLPQEAYRHFDRALDALGLRPPRGSRAIIGAAFGLVALLVYVHVPAFRARKPPSETEAQQLRLLMDKTRVLIGIDQVESFISGCNLAARFFRWASPRDFGRSLLLTSSEWLSGSGVLLGTAGRILDDIGRDVRDEEERFALEGAEQWQSFYGWRKTRGFNPDLLDFYLRRGGFSSSGFYLHICGMQLSLCGRFDEAAVLMQKTKDIAEEHGVGLLAGTYRHQLTVSCLARSRTAEALSSIEWQLANFERSGQTSFRKIALAYKADALMQEGNWDGAGMVLREASVLIAREGLATPAQTLEPAMAILEWRCEGAKAGRGWTVEFRGAMRTGRLARLVERHGRKMSYLFPKSMRLVGNYWWLRGRKRRAFRFWTEGLVVAEKLAINPEVARISFEVAKALADPKGGARALNGQDSDFHAERARSQFEQLGLAADLQELEKWRAFTRREGS